MMPVRAKPLVGTVPENAREMARENLTREQIRSRRHRDVRKVTLNIVRMPKRELEIGRALYPEDTAAERPRTRAECVDGPRPCPFVSCQHHIYLDVTRKGSITLNFPDLEPEQLAESCALDVADRGGTTLEDVGAIMNLTRERIRQVEVKAMGRIQSGLTAQVDDEERQRGRRRHLRIVQPVEDAECCESVSLDSVILRRIELEEP